MEQAVKNKVLPIGGGFYTAAYHPEEMRSSSLTEWTFFQGQTRTAESLAPKFTSGFSTLASIEVEISDNASGVLYCVGGIAGGFTAYMDDGYLKACSRSSDTRPVRLLVSLRATIDSRWS